MCYEKIVQYNAHLILGLVCLKNARNFGMSMSIGRFSSSAMKLSGTSSQIFWMALNDPCFLTAFQNSRHFPYCMLYYFTRVVIRRVQKPEQTIQKTRPGQKALFAHSIGDYRAYSSPNELARMANHVEHFLPDVLLHLFRVHVPEKFDVILQYESAY